MHESADGAEVLARLEAVATETARLREELEAAKREILALRRAHDHKTPPPARRRIEAMFLTLSAAATALGLGHDRLRALVRIGAIRTVAFPNGRVRVPRSELTRIEELGLEVELVLTPANAGSGKRRSGDRAGDDTAVLTGSADERVPAPGVLAIG
jgi:hypothetical protein